MALTQDDYEKALTRSRASYSAIDNSMFMQGALGGLGNAIKGSTQFEHNAPSSLTAEPGRIIHNTPMITKKIGGAMFFKKRNRIEKLEKRLEAKEAYIQKLGEEYSEQTGSLLKEYKEKSTTNLELHERNMKTLREGHKQHLGDLQEDDDIRTEKTNRQFEEKNKEIARLKAKFGRKITFKVDGDVKFSKEINSNTQCNFYIEHDKNFAKINFQGDIESTHTIKYPDSSTTDFEEEEIFL